MLLMYSLKTDHIVMVSLVMNWSCDIEFFHLLSKVNESLTCYEIKKI